MTTTATKIHQCAGARGDYSVIPTKTTIATKIPMRCRDSDYSVIPQ